MIAHDISTAAIPIVIPRRQSQLDRLPYDPSSIKSEEDRRIIDEILRQAEALWQADKVGSANVASQNSDAVVLPGIPATPENILHEKTRGEIILLLENFLRFGISWDDETTIHPSELTFQNSKIFIEKLPSTFSLPKAAIEEDGGILFAWNTKEHPTFLLIEEDKMHLVENAGTNESRMTDDIQIIDYEIPQAILDAIKS